MFQRWIASDALPAAGLDHSVGAGMTAIGKLRSDMQPPFLAVKHGDIQDRLFLKSA
jgi:hypothetical protein